MKVSAAVNFAKMQTAKAASVKAWNDELELTPEVIEAIKEQCPDEVEW